MENYRKTERRTFDRVGEITIREVSVLGLEELAKAQGRGDTNFRLAAIAIKHGVVEWADESVETIMENLNEDLAQEISDAVGEFSGIMDDEADDLGNSESAPAAVSSLG